MSPLFGLLLVSPALALDTEPNDSCASYELLPGLVSSGEGSLSTGSDVDAFRVNNVPPGVLNVVLLNRSNGSDDFVLRHYDAAGGTLIDSDTMSGGLASIHTTISTAAPYCLVVTGSEGGYKLISEAVGAPPTITSVTTVSGTTITSGLRGQTVKINGSGFVPDTNASVTFGVAHARILGSTGTQMTVKIPVQAADGDIVVGNILGNSEGHAFTVGVATPPVPYFTQPDMAFYDDSLGVGLFLNRTIVGFGYDVLPSAVTTKLNAALALDSFRTGWSVVGKLPALNVYQVEWTFSGTPTTVDLESLLDDIQAQGAIDFVDAELEATLATSLATPSDFDLYYAYGSGNGGALAQINFEEARRLCWLSGLSAPSQVDIYVPDSGLRFGSPAWDGSDELPEDRFRLYELSGSAGWTPTAADGHYTYSGHVYDHGTAVAGLIGARNNRSPDWSAGAARSGDDASGILSSFELFDVDDDGVDGVDTPGEWGPATVTVFNVVGSDTDSEGSLTKAQAQSAFVDIAAMPRENPGVISSSFVPPPSPFSLTHYRWPSRLAEVCRTRPIIQAAGHKYSGGVEVDGVNIIASRLAQACPGRQLVVGGTQAGSIFADVKHADANYGDEV